MSKTNKHKGKMKIKIKQNKTKKNNKEKEIILPNLTPLTDRKISDYIAKGINSSSYRPSINQFLVSLRTIRRNEITDCNNKLAFELKEPLKIGILTKSGVTNCIHYNTPEAKKFLLRNLTANKHIDTSKIIPPIQSQGNCWFNTMFVSFFVSDKGRKFFHYFRQLMIEGKQNDGTIIPEKLRDAFALLNYGVEACLTGNQYAYELNTNSIIKQIYKSIPAKYKEKIYNVDEAGNPLYYYFSILNYLNNVPLLLVFVNSCNNNWKQLLLDKLNNITHLPHIIVLEVYKKDSKDFNTKPASFTFKNASYKLDSSAIIDKSGQHFCAHITCEGKEYGYDGMSFHRLVKMKWKNKLNNDFNWQFEGTKDYDGTPLEWNYTNGYQLLMYYRV
uniref:Uncharacterized protein n=1 Tax=viral metagenome TaxID=1070528 RepID=A0A6C0IHZ5_9ZZZZ